jgi:hypothetical protein
MSTEFITTSPTSIEEIKTVVVEWLRTTPDHEADEISFSLVKPAKGLEMCTRLQRGLTFEHDNDVLSWTISNRKLSLQLGEFSVRTSFKNDIVSILVQSKDARQLSSLTEALHTAASTKYPLFYSRALSALIKITDQLSSQRIDDLSTASTDAELLLNSLLASPVIQALLETDPLAEVKLRGIEAKKELIDMAGGTMSGAHVAEVLGLTRQSVEKRRRNNKLIGLAQGRRGYVYSIFQFEGGNTLPGLEDVLKTLSEHDPWTQLIFLVERNDRLGGKTPIDLLRSGNISPVLLAASTVGEQGAA